MFVSVLLFFSYLFQPACNKCNSSPAVDRQSPSNGRPTMRLAASINMVCVWKKRHVANYLEMEGQRDGTLFGTAWTLMLSESENGISLAQGKATSLPFSVYLSQDTSLLCRPDAPTFCCHGRFSLKTPCFSYLWQAFCPFSRTVSHIYIEKVSGGLPCTQTKGRLG